VILLGGGRPGGETRDGVVNAWTQAGSIAELSSPSGGRDSSSKNISDFDFESGYSGCWNREALRFNFWTFGMHMPAVVAALYRHSALTSTAFAAAAVIACLVASYLWRSMGTCEIPDRLSCVRLLVVGFVLFGLGYALFFPGIEVNFASAGLANRIEIASAPGASCVLVAIVGLACSLPPSHLARNRTFSLAVALICAVNCLVVSGIGFFWVEASSRQQAILRSVAANVRMLPKGSALLLDGFCRYSGPGVVFETDWDATGAIQLALGDQSLVSDVVSPNLHFEKEVVRQLTRGTERRFFSFSQAFPAYRSRVSRFPTNTS